MRASAPERRSLTAAESVTGCRFPRERRLLKRSEFGRVLQAGRRIANRQFVLVYTPGLRDQARLGLTVSRRVSRSAVVRNRIRRVLREQFRRQTGLPALDIVVIARHASAAADAKILNYSAAELFSRLTFPQESRPRGH